MVDALFEAAEVMIRGINRLLRVSRFVVSPLDIARFLAVQETDDELVNSPVPVPIDTISFITKSASRVSSHVVLRVLLSTLVSWEYPSTSVRFCPTLACKN